MTERNMVRTLFAALLIVAMSVTNDASAQIWKTRKQKEREAAQKASSKKKLSRYDKLFDGKKVETARGFMTIHKVEDKIYVEFPLDYLKRDMLLTSSIESTSDAGEGYAGQFGGRAFRMHFTMEDSTLQARTSILSVPINSSDDQNIAEALKQSSVPAIYKGFKVVAYTPDSSAVVVDLKKMFFESSTFSKPFPSNAVNSYYGFVSRSHSFKDGLSRILGVKASGKCVGIRSEMSFRVDHTLMGTYSMYEDVPLTAVINKVLYLLPEKQMRPRVADSRVGVSTILKSDFAHSGSGVKAVRFARRWDVQPVDTVKYKAGEMSDVVKPVVFYMDTLLPQSWRVYVREGILEWNKAFEAIGLRDVIRVEDFPRDSLFDANDISVTTVRYSPTWINSPQVTLQSDNRTGEIINASIGIGGNMVSLVQSDRTVATMAADPRVRTKELPQQLMGEAVKLNIMNAVGEALGLSLNRGASYAYPVDSLRSVTFTSVHGITPSVMDDMLYNRIATEEDVKRGVALLNNSIGSYDMFAVKWLYKPIFTEDYRDEASILSGWIVENNRNGMGSYIRSESGFPADPRTTMDGLGNDYVKEMKYLMPNLKKAMANSYEWFAAEDKDMRNRERMMSQVFDQFSYGFGRVLTYVGGMYFDDVREGEGVSFRAVSRKQQREAFEYALELMNDMEWLDNSRYAKEFEIGNDRIEKCRLDMFQQMFSRLGYVEVCAERSDDPYTADEYLDDIYTVVWNKTLKNKSLDYVEKAVQTAFLSSLISVSTVTAKVGNFKGGSDRAFTTSQTVPADELKREMLLAKRDSYAAQQIEQKVEQIEGYAPIRALRGDNTNVSAHYYSMLLQTRDMLRGAVARASGDDKKHYTMLLYRINKALDVK